jgi:hypothetical protein
MSYLDTAGPTGAPAAVVNPESGLPATWRVRSTWEYDGRRGAWVEGNSNSYNGTLAQIVYDDAAPVRKASNLGATLGYAAALLSCRSIIGTAHDDYSTRGRAERQQRRAYYTERGIDIEARDIEEWLRYRQAGKPGPNDPYTVAPPPAPPSLADDDTLQGLLQYEGMDEVRRTYELKVHPDSAWPHSVRLVTIDGDDWAYETRAGSDWDHFVPVAVTSDGKLYSERGLSVALANKRNRMANREYALTSGTATARAKVQAAPAASPRRATPPPSDPLERAEWLGEQITMMTSAESNTYAAHTRRRIAAHRALALLNGYQPNDPENDGMTLYGTLSLHLAGLNEMARRAFDGENGDSDAVL